MFNTEMPTEELIKKYARDGELPVGYDELELIEQNYQALGAKLLSSQVWQSVSKSDPIASSRTLIRHDSDLIAKTLLEVYKTYNLQLNDE